MQKIINTIIFLAIVLITIFVWQNKSDKFELQVNNPPENTKTEENQATQTQSLTIDFEFDTNNIISLQYSYPKSENLWQITANIAENNHWNFTWEDYGDMGILIKQIKNKTNGQNNKYWQYEVDGQMPMISVDKFVPKINNNIKWIFQESEF